MSIFDTFKNKADKAREAADLRSREVWEKDPEIKRVEDELSRVGMAFLAAALGDEERREAEYKKLENRIAILKNERRDRLVALGYPADYTDVKYECEKCSDTGYVGIKMCDCLKREIIKENYKSSGLGRYLEKQTFDNFDINLYPFGEKREKMKRILDKARAYADSFTRDTSDSLLFLGGTGLGKTHISSAIAKVVIEKGYSVCYESAQNIITAFERERFFKEGEKSKCDVYFNSDLLIIDDLGAEIQSKNSVSYFYTLINTRLISGKAVIVSTNLSPEELKRHYESRIVSRLLGEYKVSLFEGEDVRRKKIQ
ncbi:MAG: ATP-binding protein [Clostridia bacterium]|nr:ATP-binding protein [Clostridia bacterium]